MTIPSASCSVLVHLPFREQIPQTHTYFPVGSGTYRDTLTAWEEPTLMQSEMPESFRELCARAQKENDLETVAEIVDRLLQAVNENSKAYSEPRNRKAGEM